MNKSESKYFKTAERMDEALLTLLEKKDFAYITIREICEQAGVNRSTFYLHYENTCDLLEESIHMIQKRFWSYFSAADTGFSSRIETCPTQELYLITPSYLSPYLTFIRDHRRMYAAAMRNPANFRADGTYREIFGNIFNPILSRFHVPEKERPFLMSFYLNGIAAIVDIWLEHDCKDPIEDIIRIIEKCVLPVTPPEQLRGT